MARELSNSSTSSPFSSFPALTTLIRQSIKSQPDGPFFFCTPLSRTGKKNEANFDPVSWLSAFFVHRESMKTYQAYSSNIHKNISLATLYFRKIVYNYPLKGRWIVVDIYRDANRWGIYPPFFTFTDPEGDSCFIIYQIRWIKKRFFSFFFF